MQTGIEEAYELQTFLPGRLVVCRGRSADYRELERFHYRAGPPATWADVWVARYYAPGRTRPRLAAVGVLSHPALSLRARERAMNLGRYSFGDRIAFVNRNIRTISRVAVHPTFRAIGLAVELVRCLIHHCPTRYVEALAVMGRAHPLFDRAGMRRVEGEEGPVYYLFDRHEIGPHLQGN